MARAHYGCPTAEGMELEDGEENNEKLSHWERRNAKDELMAKPTGGPGDSFMGFYTNLTMAAFEDMGYYKANFQMAEHMEYGDKTGCKFLTGKCMDNGVTEWPNMFCNEPEESQGAYVCTTDRLGMGVCAFGNSKVDLPSHFQYFASDKKGGEATSLTDYCPVVELSSPHWCSNSAPQGGGVPGSLYGKNSMCLDGNALKVKTNSAALPMGGVCAEISCEGGSVKVKYLGDSTDKWHDCLEGKFVTPSSTSKSFVSGTIKCPKFKEVCTVSTDGSSLVPKVIREPMEPSLTASDKPTGKPKDSNSAGKSKDSSSVPFGLIPSVAFLTLSFAGYLVA